MKYIKFSNQPILELVVSEEALRKMPSLLKERHGRQMQNVWKFGIITGLRLNDMLDIKLEDISGDKLFVKSSKKRTTQRHEIFLPPEAKEIINSVKKEHPDSEYLFQSYPRWYKANKSLTKQSVDFAFKDVGKILNVPLTTHMMRQIHIINSLKTYTSSELAEALSSSYYVSKYSYLR